MINKKIAFTTLGCKVNMYDTEAMMELFVENGYQVVEFDDFADIYLINTCTVTNFGDKKSRQMIRKAKKQNPDAIIIATGCYAQVSPEALEKIEGINIIVGTNKRKEIVNIVENYHDKNLICNYVNNIMKENDFERLSIKKLKGKTRAYLKIQEGCNKFCSYCIIPYARGPVRSRNPEDIIDEVKILSQNGFKEIVLTGIHVASYGIDLKNINLIELIKMVHKIDGIERIRFSSIEPNVVTESFVDEMKKLPKICHHFHLSLQSGCDRTLKRMNRKYTSEQYMEAVKKLKSAFKDVAFTTDVIVGFPGETEQDFLESLEFVKSVGFSKIHVFPYSPKTGTKAAEYSNQISNDVKHKRSRIMNKLNDELNLNFVSNMINQNVDVLFEKTIGNNIYEGHTGNYLKVKLKSDADLKNKIVNVKIKAILYDGSLEGIL